MQCLNGFSESHAPLEKEDPKHDIESLWCHFFLYLLSTEESNPEMDLYLSQGWITVEEPWERQDKERVDSSG